MPVRRRLIAELLAATLHPSCLLGWAHGSRCWRHSPGGPVLRSARDATVASTGWAKLQDASAIIPHQMTSARGAERCLALSQAAARKWENDTWSASHFSDWSKLWHHVHPFFRPPEPLGCDLICDNTWTRDAALPDPPNTRPLCVPLLLALHFCYPPLRARTDESFSASFVFIFPIPCKSSALALMVCDICSSASPRQGSCS